MSASNIRRPVLIGQRAIVASVLAAGEVRERLQRPEQDGKVKNTGGAA